MDVYCHWKFGPQSKPRALRLCLSAHGCLHVYDQRAAGQSAPDPTADLETATTNIMLKCSRNSS